MHLKKKLLIIAIVFVVVVALAVTGLVIFTNPKNVALRSVKGFTGDLLERQEIASAKKILTNGSVKLTLDEISQKQEDEYVDILEDGHVSGKIYFATDSLMLKDVDVELYGAEIAGEAYLSRDRFYIREDKILDSAYGADLETLADELKDSIFAPDSGTSYALDEELFDQIIDVLEKSDETTDLVKDAKALIESVQKDLLMIVMKNARITSEKTSHRVGGEKTNVRLIRIKVDADAAQDIVNAVYDYLCDSDDIRDFINKYDDTLLEALTLDDDYDSLEDAYDELLESFEDEMDDLCDAIDKYFKTLKITLVTPKMSAKLLQLEVEYDKETLFLLDCGKKGIKKTDAITLEVSDTKLTYDVEKNNDSAYKAALVFDDGREKQTLSISIDKKKEKYNLTYEDVGTIAGYYDDDHETMTYSNTYQVKGTYSKSGDKTTLMVDEANLSYESPYSNYESEWRLDCTLVFDTSDSMPQVPNNYKSISDITEKTMDKWLDKVNELF